VKIHRPSLTISVYCAEPQVGASWYGTVQHALQEQDRGRVVWPQDRPEDPDRVDHGQFESASFALDEILCRPFGDRLGFLIGLQARIVMIRPILFRESCGVVLLEDRESSIRAPAASKFIDVWAKSVATKKTGGARLKNGLN